MSNNKSLPPPGLQGDYRDACVACLRPADTALALIGEAEWHVAAMHLWGVPQDQAVWMLCDLSGTPHDGGVPRGELSEKYRVCERCAAKTHMHTGPALRGSAIPAYHAPSGQLVRALKEGATQEVIESDGRPVATLVTGPEQRFLVPPVVLDPAGQLLQGEHVLQAIVDTGVGMELPQLGNAGPGDLAVIDRQVAAISMKLGIPVWNLDFDFGGSDELPPFATA